MSWPCERRRRRKVTLCNLQSNTEGSRVFSNNGELLWEQKTHLNGTSGTLFRTGLPLKWASLVSVAEAIAAHPDSRQNTFSAIDLLLTTHYCRKFTLVMLLRLKFHFTELFSWWGQLQAHCIPSQDAEVMGPRDYCTSGSYLRINLIRQPIG